MILPFLACRMFLNRFNRIYAIDPECAVIFHVFPMAKYPPFGGFSPWLSQNPVIFRSLLNTTQKDMVSYWVHEFRVHYWSLAEIYYLVAIGFGREKDPFQFHQKGLKSRHPKFWILNHHVFKLPFGVYSSVSNPSIWAIQFAPTL